MLWTCKSQHLSGAGPKRVPALTGGYDPRAMPVLQRRGQGFRFLLGEIKWSRHWPGKGFHIKDTEPSCVFFGFDWISSDSQCLQCSSGTGGKKFLQHSRDIVHGRRAGLGIQLWQRRLVGMALAVVSHFARLD